MERAKIRRTILMTFLLLVIGGGSTVQAAEVTDVLDAADVVWLENKAVDDYFDIRLKANYRQSMEWADLKYEHVDKIKNKLILHNDLKYERVINQIDMDLEIGMFHDLSIHFGLPIVLSDQVTYSYDKFDEVNVDTNEKKEVDVTGATSKLAGSGENGTVSEGMRIIPMTDGQDLSGPERSGIGDLTIGLRWSPINTEHYYDPQEPWRNNTGRSTMTLGFDYTAPIGEVRSVTNEAVARGLHELKFHFAASQQFSFVEPYFRLLYALPLNSGSSGFKDYNDAQQRVTPGMWGQIDAGIEFTPWKRMKLDFQSFVKIDLRMYFRYISEGREYSELLDGIAKNTDCLKGTVDSTDPRCAWMSNKWSNAGEDAMKDDAILNKLAKENYDGINSIDDGIYSYEGYGVFGAMMSLRIQPVQWVEIFGGASFDYSQDHFITFAKVGRDVNTLIGDDGKELSEPVEGKDYNVSLNDPDERSPVYHERLDAVGQRIRKIGTMRLDWLVGLKVMY